MNYQIHRNRQAKTGAVYRQLVYTDPAGRRVTQSLGRSTLKEARAKRELLIAEHAKNPHNTGKNEQLRLTEWLERYKKIRTDIGKSTLNQHVQTGRLLVEFFHHDPLIQDIQRSAATDWRMALYDRDYEESTVCKHAKHAKVILNWAVKDGVLRANPFDQLKVTPPVKDPLSRRIVTPDEFRRVMEVCPEIQRMLGLCFYAGLRTHEALHLPWSGVDLERGRLVVKTREGIETTKQSSREIRLEPELVDLLQSREGTTVAGLKAYQIHDLRIQACKDAGVEPFIYTDLRRSRAVQWREDGFSDHVVCYWLAHSESTARRHYLRAPESSYDIPATADVIGRIGPANGLAMGGGS